jgi:hypothetical protein
MKSATLPSFWEKYRAMSPAVRAGARKAYRLWAENPFYPSLHFKCIDSDEDIWSVRVTKSHQANDDAMARPHRKCIALPLNVIFCIQLIKL